MGDLTDQTNRVLAALADGPKSTRELAPTGASTADLRELERAGLLKIDPDQFPGEYVPGNPLIARLPDDARRWPGWKAWNL